MTSGEKVERLWVVTRAGDGDGGEHPAFEIARGETSRDVGLYPFSPTKEFVEGKRENPLAEARLRKDEDAVELTVSDENIAPEVLGYTAAGAIDGSTTVPEVKIHLADTSPDALERASEMQAKVVEAMVSTTLAA